MKKMEIGVLAMLRKGENPFPAIHDLGLTTAQLQNWDMTNLNPETAEKVKHDLTESGIRLAAFWAGYTGKIVWNSYGGPETCGLVPRDQRTRRVDELKRGADFAKMIGAPAIITHCGFIPENPMDPLYKETVDAIREVALHCKELGIGFWFEAGQETPLTLLRTIEDVGLDNLGVNLDTANCPLIAINSSDCSQINNDVFIGIMAHEMTHIWQFAQGRRGGHGRDFKNEMRRIGLDYANQRLYEDSPLVFTIKLHRMRNFNVTACFSTLRRGDFNRQDQLEFYLANRQSLS